MKKNNKGFTLAELLIVVAIIAVLVAIAIPVFTSQLEKSRDAVTESNVRAAYAEAASKYLTDGADAGETTESVTITGVKVKGQQTNSYFDSTELPFDVAAGLKTALDKAADDAASSTGISVKFTWTLDTNGSVTKVEASAGA